MQARLSPTDRETIHRAVAALQAEVEKAGLRYIPVFGYLSLRTDNFRELGKKSQRDVVPGRDVVDATLLGFGIDVVASTVFRGTPEHPGIVAGLSRREGSTTPGVLLKVSLSRAEELLAVLLAREFFAEGDLVDPKDAQGRLQSNAMYIPTLEAVEAEGRKVRALVFRTNPKSAKSLERESFGDADGLTPERMAYLMNGRGGFVRDGKRFGGTSVAYWSEGYVAARKASGQPIDPRITQAIELSKLMPSQEALDRILARRDPDAELMKEALLYLFKGAAVPIRMRFDQKPGLGGLERTQEGGPNEDAEGLLLSRAKELEREGRIGTPRTRA
jgi:hypothetical protein